MNRRDKSTIVIEANASLIKIEQEPDDVAFAPRFRLARDRLVARSMPNQISTTVVANRMLVIAYAITQLLENKTTTTKKNVI